MDHKTNQTLNIAFAGNWKTIHPGLQHTLVGDFVLGNQFEALIKLDGTGQSMPLGAKRWSVSQDYRVFRFEIDNSRKFSDGVSLTANHYKESWEKSYLLEPKSANSSLLDVLYKLEGFSDFERHKEFTGLKVIDASTLEVRFSSSFRMALEHLAGNRFAAFREVGEKFLGTGAYVIEDLQNGKLALTPNEFFPEPAQHPIVLSSIAGADSLSKLIAGELDVVAYVVGSAVSAGELKARNNLSVIFGQDALHRALYMNSKKNRFFANIHYRQALQYLLFEHFQKRPELIGEPEFNTFDMQIYLPQQTGRITELEAVELISRGRPYVADFIEATKNSPLVLIETKENSMRTILEDIGVSFSPQSRRVDKSTIIEIIYKGEEADLIPGTFGIAAGDPDGTYHKLGRNGAIASPMTHNEVIADLLEEGRRLVEKSQVDTFYRKVSRAILFETPFVHLGFNKAITIFRNDLVKVEKNKLSRSEGDLQIFEVIDENRGD